MTVPVQQTPMVFLDEAGYYFGGQNDITSALQTERNTGFACEWALPEFKFSDSGFLVAGEQEAPFTCKYCGLPSWIDPSDQSPPPDYCHEIDHGTAEDRAVFVRPSIEGERCQPTS